MRRVYVAIICLCLVMCAVFGTLFVKEVFFSGSASGGASTDDEARTDKNVDVTLEPGKHMVLELSEGDEKRLSSWSSGDSEIVTVDSGGRIDACGVGETEVLAKFSDGHIYTYRVTVNVGEVAPAVSKLSSAITANQDVLEKNLKNNGEKLPYEIRVNRKLSCVTVYTYEENGEYTVPVRAMICSCGADDRTPTGDYTLYFHANWHPLVDNLFGQYSSAFSDELLFHSVPYTDLANDTLEIEEFNKLGTPASKGCVRMTVSDCKWICDNCAADTAIVIYDSDDVGPLGKPEMVRITDMSCGWEPTDPDPRNPYHKLVPQISGAKDLTVEKGGEYTPAEGVTATDTCGNDITDKIKVEGNVVPDRAGVYKVTYIVTDALNRSAEETVTITVE